MTSKAEKLLQRMQNSKNGWKRIDLDHLYEGFGFIIKPGKKHDIAVHPLYPQLRGTLSRQNKVLIGYVETAIEIILELKTLEEKDNESQKPQKS